MRSSEQINEIAAALVQCQGMLETAKKDTNNPYFKSKYADLAGVIDAAKSAMQEAGLAINFNVTNALDGVTLTPILLHKTGQFFEYDPFTIYTKDKTAQGQGSAITYGRRYLYQTIIGIAAEDDDDGNSASGRIVISPQQPPHKQEPRQTQKEDHNWSLCHQTETVAKADPTKPIFSGIVEGDQKPVTASDSVMFESVETILRGLSHILGPKDKRIWTEKQMTDLDLVAMYKAAMASLDPDIARVVVLRAEIADKYRNDPAWPQVISDIIAKGTDLDALKQMQADASRTRILIL